MQKAPLSMEGGGVASFHNDLLAILNVHALGIRIPAQFPTVHRIPVITLNFEL